MEGTQTLEVLSGFGKTHVCGNEINNINSISNLLKNLWRNTSFFACHLTSHHRLCYGHITNLVPFEYQILSRRFLPSKPALPRRPCKCPPAHDVKVQMEDTLPGSPSGIRNDPISATGNFALPGHLGTDDHQVA